MKNKLKNLIGGFIIATGGVLFIPNAATADDGFVAIECTCDNSGDCKANGGEIHDCWDTKKCWKGDDNC